MSTKPAKSKKKHPKKHETEKHNNLAPTAVSRELTLEKTLEMTNLSLSLYRTRMEGFINDNENLNNMCIQQEQDAVFLFNIA